MHFKATELRLWLGFCSQKGAVAVRQPYIRVVGIEQAHDGNSGGPSAFTLDEVRPGMCNTLNPIVQQISNLKIDVADKHIRK